MNKNNIPSVEDFARARAAMKERDLGLSEVRSNILKHFREFGLHEAFIFYSPENNLFVAHLFFLRNAQIEESDRSGLLSEIKQKIFKELEMAGRGGRESMKVEFEFDSHENVEANFEGDYYRRLQ